ncbi:MAG: DUF6444 domain-containing protein [Bacteroidaceae bacterium]|nr:DUF6444 domain-containing protein [Bacteroidaceae bacterium]
MEKDFNTGLRRSLESDRIKLTRRRKQLLREMGYSEDLDSAEIAEKLHEQVRANNVLNRSVVRQEEEIKKLKARIVELETGQKPIAKTSANSSVPPSKNPIGVPHTQSQRKPSGRKTGGQKGHPGSTRLQTDNVTATERWYPVAVCPVCGKPLDIESATVGARRQEVDIPVPIAAEVIDHLLMQVKCSCGHFRTKITFQYLFTIDDIKVLCDQAGDYKELKEKHPEVLNYCWHNKIDIYKLAGWNNSKYRPVRLLKDGVVVACFSSSKEAANYYVGISKKNYQGI